MGVLVIITMPIPEPLHIIIDHRSNFILSFLNCLSCTLLMFLFVCILLLFFLHLFKFLFILSICILLWTYLMNQTFVNILPTKSRMKKNITGTKLHQMKFIKFYLLKRQNWFTTKLFMSIKRIYSLSLVVRNSMEPNF